MISLFLCIMGSSSPFKAIRQNLAEAQRVVAGSGSEEDKIEARIGLEVYEALQHSVTS